MAKKGDKVKIHYGTLIASTGCCVDSSRSKTMSQREPVKYPVGKGAVVTGMDVGLMSLPLGSLARLHVPSRLAYADQGSGAVMPHTDLVFEVEVLAINGETATPRDTWRLRELLMLPPVTTQQAAAGGAEVEEQAVAAELMAAAPATRVCRRAPPEGGASLPPAAQ